MQASKQVLDRVLPSPISYADLCAIAGAVGVYNTHGPLINVGYGRPDVDGPDPFQGVGSNTNQGRDYPIQELINEWGELTLLTGRPHSSDLSKQFQFDALTVETQQACSHVLSPVSCLQSITASPWRS